MIIQPYAWIEISESALRHNSAQLKALIGSTSSLGAVIKSNAYGHGAEQISIVMDRLDTVDWLCVGYLSEALKIRAWGIKKPLLVMSCLDDNPALAAHQNIHFIVGDMQRLSCLYTIAQQTGVVFDVHLKVDTGLSRFGVLPGEVQQIINEIKNMRGIRLSGICTHFAESYKEDQSFTKEQITLFAQIISAIGTRPRWIHASNSAATVAAQVPFVNLFRVGLGMYGYWSSSFVAQVAKHRVPTITLKPILTFKTRIMEIKHVKKGSTIGYDRTYVAHDAMTIALLPIGYYDGYDFRLCNKSIFYSNEKPHALVGKVAMNTVAIDITQSPELLIGSEVMIMGDKPGITASDVANRIGEPNPRKVMTNLAAHIPRILVV